MTHGQSRFFAEARQVIAGGVNSPVRAWKSVGGEPIFVNRAFGSKIYDTSGKDYIDYVLSWGPMILGHAHPDVIRAICRAAEQGTSFGAPTETETEMAKLICEAIPSIERVRMTNSGTEATMTAIRLARGYTGRDMVIKFDGCYHGHADSLLIKAGSGIATLGIPGSPGIPRQLAELTLSLPYNDEKALENVIAKYGPQTAAVIVEPVPGNMGVVLPKETFLQTLRRLTTQFGIVLIFDEVITGFRFCFGGYQNLIGIQPDLPCLGKIIGGGMPVGALGGKREIMERLAPLGDVYQAGTLSGNPLAMIAGKATLDLLKSKDHAFRELTKADFLRLEIEKIFKERVIAVCINQFGSMFTVFFQPGPVDDLQSAMKSDTGLYARFFHGMLKHGVWLAPSQFEAGFLSFAHSQGDLDQTLSSVLKTLQNL
jgi:glutamate-1-semialdehyde 2,1-aminomutase